MDHITTNPENIQVFLEQFMKSIQATISLTQSLQSLQTTVALVSSELSTVKEDIRFLRNLVQGTTSEDGLFRHSIEHDTRLANVEKWQKDFDDGVRTQKPLHLGRITLIVATITSILTALLSTFVPILLKKGP